MGAKSAEEIHGLEFDWLATDGDGNVALFSTAGGGFAPEAFLRDTDAHDAAIDTVLAWDARTQARFAPQVSPGLRNTWLLIAERGHLRLRFGSEWGTVQAGRGSATRDSDLRTS